MTIVLSDVLRKGLPSVGPKPFNRGRTRFSTRSKRREQRFEQCLSSIVSAENQAKFATLITAIVEHHVDALDLSATAAAELRAKVYAASGAPMLGVGNLCAAVVESQTSTHPRYEGWQAGDPGRLASCSVPGMHEAVDNALGRLQE